jgi:hypothetical protein
MKQLFLTMIPFLVFSVFSKAQNKSNLDQTLPAVSYYTSVLEGKFIFVDRIVLYTNNNKVTGFYGWAAQTESAYYLVGEKRGNVIVGQMQGLDGREKSPFTLKILKNTAVGLSHLGKAVPIDVDDIFKSKDGYSYFDNRTFTIYQSQDKASAPVKINYEISDKGFRLVEIGKIEKCPDQDCYTEYDIWYKIKNKDIEGWVFGLIRTL